MRERLGVWAVVCLLCAPGVAGSMKAAVDGEVVAPVKIYSPNPSYTESARRQGITGRVVVEAIISKQGTVSSVTVVEELSEELDRAAVETVQRWRFEPATLNGEPVEVIYTLTVNFELQHDTERLPATGKILGTIGGWEGPVEAARVRLFGALSSPDPREQTHEYRGTQTASDGTFELEAPSLTGYEISFRNWILVIERPAMARQVLRVVDDLGYSDGVTDVGFIPPERGCRLTGVAARKSDGEPKPVAGARVTLWTSGLAEPLEARSNEDGSFEFEEVQPGPYSLAIEARGFSPYFQPYVDACKGDAETEVLDAGLLEGRLEFRGRVQDEAGLPIPSAVVELYAQSPPGAPIYWLSPEVTKTDSHGRFTIGLPKGNLDHWMIVSKPGFVTNWRPTSSLPAQGRDRRERSIVDEPGKAGVPLEVFPIVIRPSNMLKGVITGPGGSPVRDAEARATREGSSEPAGPVALSDSDGSIEITGLSPGLHALTVRHPEYEDLVRDFSISADAEGAEYLTLKLRPKGTTDLRVDVLDFFGKPVATAQVGLFTDDDASWKCTTSSAGVCRLEAISGSGEGSLRVDHPEEPVFFDPDFSWEPTTASTTVRLEERPWHIVEVVGSVVADQEPVAGAVVTLSDATVHAAAQRKTRTREDGSFAFARVVEGVYRLSVKADQYPEIAVGVKATTGAEPIEVRLVSGSTISGRVVGEMLPGAAFESVWACPGPDSPPEDETPRVEGFSIGPDGVSQPCAASGEITGPRYSIGGVIPGAWTVGAWVGDVHVETWVEVPPGVDEVTADLVLPRPAQARVSGSERWAAEEERIEQEPARIFTGRVVDEKSGVGIEGARIAHWGQKLITSDQGYFTLGTKAPEFGLEITKDGYVSLDVEGPLREALAADIALEPTPGLRYSIQWHDGGLPTQPILRLTPHGGGEPLGQFRSAEGHWPNVAPGRYTFEVDYGLGEVSIPVTVPGPLARIVLPPSGAVHLRVLDLELEIGAPDWLEGVVVDLEPLGGQGSPERRTGRLRIVGLAPGPWLATIRAPDGRTWVSHFEVRDQRWTTVMVR